MSKAADTHHPVHDLVAKRFSPYGFAERPVSPSDLRSLFEAARWAASSYNEQPWSYVVATREEEAEFARVLSCLVEPNQKWARHAPVIGLGIVTREFTRNGKPNKAAVHDLGAASATLTFEATARGLTVHQMIGIEPDRAREEFGIPEGSEAWTGLAIGYPELESDRLPDELKERDAAARTRKPLADFVFGGRFGQPSPLVSG